MSINLYRSKANGNPASTPTNLMRALHTQLVLSGWTLVYADVDALSGNTLAQGPLWNKVLAASVSLGTVVYKMPAVAIPGVASPTRWCLRINLATQASANNVNYTATSGTDCDAGGVLTAASTAYALSAGTSNVSMTDWYVSAYEHGLLIATFATQGAFLFHLERRRKLVSGDVLDDLTFNVGQSITTVAVFGAVSGNNWPSGASFTRSLTAESTASLWNIIKNSSGSAPATMQINNGTSATPVGPECTSPERSGIPRLFQVYSAGDIGVGVLQNIVADGATRQYFTTSDASYPPAGGLTVGYVWAFAAS